MSDSRDAVAALRPAGALALVQGAAASDRRGRRRFVGIGLALVAVAVALVPLGALGWLAGLLLGIFLPDPNSLTAEDREIMAREQAEADAAERRAKGEKL